MEYDGERCAELILSVHARKICVDVLPTRDVDGWKSCNSHE